MRTKWPKHEEFAALVEEHGRDKVARALRVTSNSVRNWASGMWPSRRHEARIERWRASLEK